MFKSFLNSLRTTSKQLTWFYSILYAVQVGVSMYAKMKYDKDLSPFMAYTTPLIGGILGSYFYKSFKEKKDLTFPECPTNVSTEGQ